MSEADFHPAAEPESSVPSFSGDPVAAAALARERAQAAWKWGWLCALVAIGSWVSFGILLSLAGRAAGANDWTSGISLLFAVGSSIAACVCFYRVYSQRRAAAMADACETMGFHFTEKVDKLRLTEFIRLPLFRRGHGQKGCYLMEGEVGGWPVSAMEYYYTTGSGKHQQVHCQTVVIIGRADDLPDFELRPKTIWRKLGEALGFVNITFANNPAFMKAYYVSGPDEKEIRAYFGPATLAFFAERPGWNVEAQDGYSAVYKQDKSCPAAEYPQRVAEALAMLRQLLAEEVSEPQISGPTEPEA
jgi:hypothetical protein